MNNALTCNDVLSVSLLVLVSNSVITQADVVAGVNRTIGGSVGACVCQHDNRKITGHIITKLGRWILVTHCFWWRPYCAKCTDFLSTNGRCLVKFPRTCRPLTSNSYLTAVVASDRTCLCSTAKQQLWRQTFFSVVGPRVRNDLPPDLWQVVSYGQLKRQLKTFRFCLIRTVEHCDLFVFPALQKYSYFLT